MSVRLSSVTIALNEERYIGRMIKSVKPWVDEMVVLDGGSTDDTIRIARNMGARIEHHIFDYNFGSQRNWAKVHARGRWILSIDCDEVLEPDLAARLPHLMAMGDQHATDCFQISEKNLYEGEPEEPVESLMNWPDYHRRLFRSYCHWEGYIHEQLKGWSKEWYVPTEWGSIQHRKTREDQAQSDDLYYNMRPTDYPDRLAKDEAMQNTLHEHRSCQEAWLAHVRTVNPSRVVPEEERHEERAEA